MLNKTKAFTLVEMLIALLIVSIVISATMPLFTTRAGGRNTNLNSSMPVGSILIWPKVPTVSKADANYPTYTPNTNLPDDSWHDCDGAVIPASADYKELRDLIGANYPDYRGVFLRQTDFGTSTAASYSRTLGMNQLQYDSISKLAVPTAIAGRVKLASGAVSVGSLGASAANVNYIDIAPSASGASDNTTNEVRPINKSIRFIIKAKR